MMPTCRLFLFLALTAWIYMGCEHHEIDETKVLHNHGGHGDDHGHGHDDDHGHDDHKGEDHKHDDHGHGADEAHDAKGHDHKEAPKADPAPENEEPRNLGI